MQLGGVAMAKLREQTKPLLQSFQKFGLEALIALENVPFIGKPVSDASKARLKALDAEMIETQNRIKAFGVVENNLKIKKDQLYNDYKNRDQIRQNKVDEEILKQQADAFIEGQAKGDDEARNKALADKKSFLDKLNKLEQDTDDQSALEKIQRKRERHLAELEALKLSTTEKKDAVLRINGIYDEL